MSDAGRGAEPAGFGELRAELEAAGYRPSRRLGQNLLTDPNMARALARDAGVAAGDFVLEVGPGGGALTLELVRLGVRLLAVEIDARLLALVRRRVAALAPPDAPGDASVTWIEGDVLASKHALAGAVLDALPERGPWHVVSNLPYAAGTPFVATAARLANPPRSMTCLVQLELARRIASGPGTGDWGPLAARIQLAYRASIGRSVPAHLFWPVPKVESAVLRLERREAPPDPTLARAFEALTEVLFRHRRQSLGRVLRRVLGDRERARELLGRHGLEAAARPEELDLAALAALAADPAWPAAPGNEP